MIPAHTFWAVCFALTVTTTASAQENAPVQDSGIANPPVSTITVPPPPAEANDFRISSDVELVLLDVSVKGHNGGFVSGLDKDAFEVLENNVDQPLTVFSAKDVPVTVGLVIDNSGSVRPVRPEIVTAALTFVKESNPADEVFIVNFNDRVSMGLPEGLDFSSDHNVLRDALLHNPAQGRTALYDAISRALDHLGKGLMAKKTLIVVADGGDNMSDLDRQQLIDKAERSLATIYTVGVFNPQDKGKDPGFLKKLARITGGEAFMPKDISNLVGVCEKIAHDIRNRYTLGYIPTNREHDGKIRRLKVTATGPDGKKCNVRTRTHYYPATDIAADASRKAGK